MEQENKKIIGHFLLVKLGAFLKQFFTLNDKAVNLGDGMGMRVPYILIFRGQSEFIDILSNEISKNM